MVCVSRSYRTNISRYLKDLDAEHESRFAGAIVEGAEGLVLDLVGDPQDLALRHRPLKTRPLQAGENLLPVPGDPPPVLLDDGQPDVLFNAFVGGEPLLAIEALPPPPDRPPALGA